MVPCERALKTVPETGVKSDPAFCLGPTIKKTNSGLSVIAKTHLNKHDFGSAKYYLHMDNFSFFIMRCLTVRKNVKCSHSRFRIQTIFMDS